MIKRLHEVEGITLDFDSSIPCFLATCTGYLTSQDYRGFCEFGIKCVREKVAEYGKVAWLTDLRKSEIFDDDDVKWTNEYWNIQINASGLQYLALVMSEDIFAAINIEHFIKEHERRKDPLVIELFADVDSAEAWCRKMLAL